MPPDAIAVNADDATEAANLAINLAAEHALIRDDSGNLVKPRGTLDQAMVAGFADNCLYDFR